MTPYTIIEEKIDKMTIEINPVIFRKIQKIMDNDFSYFEAEELSAEEKKTIENNTHFNHFNQTFNQLKI